MLVRRFLQEMLELRTLRHPNIIRFVGSDLDEFNVPFLVTEYAPDGDLMDLVQERGRLEQDLAIDIVLGVLDGLKYMHTQSDIHRDIKPQNILLRRVTLGCEDRYVPKIADFGLVKNVFRAGGGDITGLGEAMGSFEFMPPEQPSEFRTLQPSADIYATGATLYFALTGSYVIEIPPEADDQGKLGCVARAERIPIRRRLPSISSALAGVIDKACSADPLQRFQSAEEFRARLVEARG
jgi:serine/threonine-protein kinase